MTVLPDREFNITSVLVPTRGSCEAVPISKKKREKEKELLKRI
jgi:hypothetical protein